jgi:hypothetical protein
MPSATAVQLTSRIHSAVAAPPAPDGPDRAAAVAACRSFACLREAHKRPAGEARFNFPHAMIIGFPKCATTSLYAYLSHHPEGIASSVKARACWALSRMRFVAARPVGLANVDGGALGSGRGAARRPVPPPRRARRRTLHPPRAALAPLHPNRGQPRRAPPPTPPGAPLLHALPQQPWRGGLAGDIGGVRGGRGGLPRKRDEPARGRGSPPPPKGHVRGFHGVLNRRARGPPGGRGEAVRRL